MITVENKHCGRNPGSGMEGKLLRIMLGTALVALIWFAAGCEEKKAGKKVQPPRVVKVERAAQRGLALTVTTSGTTAPIQHSRLNFEVPGVVSKVFVTMGDRVRKGQELAKLEDTDYFLLVAQARMGLNGARATLRKLKAGFRPEEKAQAQAGVDAAEAGLEQARTNFERMKRLLDQKHVSESTCEQARTAYEVARAQHEQAAKQLALVEKGFRQEDIDVADAQVTAAQTALRMANERLRDTALHAPYAGVIVKVNIDPGDKVPGMPGRAAIEIVDISQLELVVPVVDTYALRMSEGAAAVVDLDGGPGGLKTRISGISGVIDRVNRALPVRIVLKNPGLKLKAGMFARVRITYSTVKGLAVPSSAVQEDASGEYVLVYERGRAKRRPVQAGVSRGGYVIIKPMSLIASATAAVMLESVSHPPGTLTRPFKEITEGELVIVEGNYGLRHGAPVVLAGEETGKPGKGGR